MTTLIISPSTSWGLQAQKSFIKKGLPCDIAHTGKDAQLMAYQRPYLFFVLDLEVKNHDGIDVLKYIRKQSPQSKVLLTVSSPEKLDELLVDDSKFIKASISKILFQPRPEQILTEVQQIGNMRTWDNDEASHSHEPTVEEEIHDQEFSRIKISDLFVNSKAVFDYYLRLGANRFVKFVHKGEIPSKEQIAKYATNGADFIYFLNKDRAKFISYQNDLAKKHLKDAPKDGVRVINAMKSTVDKYLDEIFVTGIRPQLVEEGKAICQNIYDAAIQDPTLKKYINDLEQFNPAALSHTFLVTFFAAIICKDLEWVGTKTLHTIALGALLHDIGMQQLPLYIQDMDPATMNEDQRKIYNTHPSLGAIALKAVEELNPGVSQIVMQHHEHINGSGFPAGLSGNQIYPLAKVISLADGFSYFLKEQGISPIDSLKLFLKDQKNLLWYDPLLVKNLIKALR